MPRHLLPVFHSREQAGKLLAKKLTDYRFSSAIVMGIPPAGLIVASGVAKELHLHLHVLPCRKIRHPSISGKNIGSVSADEIHIQDSNHDLPQDYIYHQVVMLRNVIGYEQRFYNDRHAKDAIRGNDVIVVDEILQNSSCIKACLQTIRKFEPKRIIVAAPMVSLSAALELSVEVDDIISVHQESTIPGVDACYEEQDSPEDATIKQIFDRTNRMTTA